ncbi:hypothetical protein FOA43_002187 [Brettanomyces nanus]|uniref:RWD domain-containing protein n=1 Tax=Eeniella nana TaxID=13502 RepID=A0A875RZ95_EENNA|nr:uncharacterized protein FOA43_002187 [Brettanomyces nanus]QPG74851.1 hypothetical protein FOA43_002187 [Brettanomyces nanus]
MDPLKEQKQEVEILKSIYPDELELISGKEFTINLLLDVSSERKHAVKLHIRYPAAYPEVAPELWVTEGEIGIDGDDDDGENYNSEDGDDDSDDQETVELKDSQRAVNLIETIDLGKNDYSQLAEKLDKEAKLNIGMPSAFTLASVLKDEAEQLFNDKVEQEAQKLENLRVVREKKEQRKFVGTKVTDESFSKWRAKIREEMGYDGRMKKRFQEIHQGKLTGKEIFERGLAGEEDASTATVNEVAEGVDKVII